MENHLFETCATDNVISKTDAAWKRATEPPAFSQTQHAEALVAKSPRYLEVYYEYVLKGIFIKDLHESVHRGMPSYWSPHPGSTL